MEMHRRKRTTGRGSSLVGQRLLREYCFLVFIQGAQEQIIMLMMLMILMMMVVVVVVAMMMMMMMMMIRKVKTRLQIWMSPLLPFEVSNKLSTPIKRK